MKLNLSNPPPEENNSDEGNWLVSYADMMTLLCGFFILLFSMSKLDTPKYDSFKKEVAQHFKGKYSPPYEALTQSISELVKKLKLENSAHITTDPTGVSVTFESTIFFDTLSSSLTNEGKLVLSDLMNSIYQIQTKNKHAYKIIVEGHTDSRPIISGLYPSNWELSSARASRVVRMFLEKGFSAQNLIAIGYADTHPFIKRDSWGKIDEISLAKNRRVVLRILDEKADSIPFPESPH